MATKQFRNPADRERILPGVGQGRKPGGRNLDGKSRILLMVQRVETIANIIINNLSFTTITLLWLLDYCIASPNALSSRTAESV